jgi:hypothetical protein
MISVKAKAGNQWSIHEPNKGNVTVKEIKAQYHYKADTFQDWQPLAPDSKYLKLIQTFVPDNVRIIDNGQVQNTLDPGHFDSLIPVPPIRGLLASIRVVEKLKGELVKEIKLLEGSPTLEERLIKSLDIIIQKATELREML